MGASKSLNLPCLGGIRGYAVLLVLFSHASNYGLNLHSSAVFSGAGRYGVFLFFVLSSFLLTRQFLIRDNSRTSWPEFLRHYILRRFLRIFPLYVLCLSIYFIVSVLFKPLYVENWQIYLNSMVLLDGPGVFWSIPVEFQFYFVLPLISLALVALWNFPLVLTLGMMLFVFVWQSVFEPEYKPYLAPFMSIFVAGSFTAYLYEYGSKHGANLIHSNWFKKCCNLISLASFLSFIIFIPHFYNILFGAAVDIGYFHYDFILWAVLSSVLVLSTLWSDSTLCKLFESKIMVFWGNVSFSAYLGHMLILKMLTYIGVESEVGIIIFIGLVAVFSYLSYRFFELPMSKVHHIKKLGLRSYNVLIGINSKVRG